MTHLRHIATIDTREQEYVEGKGYRGISGTGEPLPCHCCGRTHEVHALILEQRRTEAGAWEKVADHNFGVSCAKKVTTVPSGYLIRKCDMKRFDRLLLRARAAA